MLSRQEILLGSNDLAGSKKVTCKEAARLLREEKIWKAIFRPDGVISYGDPDQDVAFVWMVN